jgi:N,N'-diacetyllegionaminate synthase
MPEIRINGRPIGRDHPPYVIAEAGINHNGETARALAMVRVAKAAGADAIKFQTFTAEEFIADSEQTYTYLSQGREVTESMLEMFRRHELPRHAWPEIKAECDRSGITFLSTPQNQADLDLLLDVGLHAVKIGSDDFTNLPLLKLCASTGLPLILSCGMADMADVHRSLETVGALDGYATILLLCTSQYPTPPADVNLKRLVTLQAAFPMLVVGFSDHTQGPLASSLATALGAAVLEKHFTLDHGLPGPDHWFSEDPDGLGQWVAHVRRAFEMLGTAVVRPTMAEQRNRRQFRRFIVAADDIAEGTIYSPSNLTMRRVRSGVGLPPALYDLVLGRTANRAYRAGEAIQL